MRHTGIGLNFQMARNPFRRLLPILGATHEKTQLAGHTGASEMPSSKMPMASKLGHGPVVHGF